MKNVLAVALVVAVASVALSQNPRKEVPDEFRARPALPPAPPPAPVAAPAGGAAPLVLPIKTQKWEYKVSDRGGFEPGDWQKKLNDLAAQGWELDAIDEGHYILRRAVVTGVRAEAIRGI